MGDSNNNNQMRDSNNNENFIPHADHLANSPITKISPTPSNESLSIIEEAEAKFKKACKNLNGPIQMVN